MMSTFSLGGGLRESLLRGSLVSEFNKWLRNVSCLFFYASVQIPFPYQGLGAAVPETGQR